MKFVEYLRSAVAIPILLLAGLMSFIWVRPAVYLLNLSKWIAGIALKLEKLPVAFREALALHNVFMAFGIAESDIYVAYNEKAFRVIAYQNREHTEDRLEFRVDVAGLNLSDEDFIKAWTVATKVYNQASYEERNAMLDASWVRKHAATIVFRMSEKGFRSTAAEELGHIVSKPEGLN